MRKNSTRIVFFPLLLISIAFVTTGQAQPYMERFKKLSSDNNFSEQKKLLAEWESKTLDDPDLYVAYINYYFNLSSSGLSITKEKPQAGQSIAITKPGADKPVAYIGDSGQYDSALVEKGIDWIDKGIKKFPDRLDMRFGKVYVLGRVHQYARFATEVAQAVSYSKDINNKWLWRDGVPLDDPKNRMLSMVQDYVVELYDSGDEQIRYVKQIADKVLEIYPDTVEFLSDLSIYYIIKKDFDSALLPLIKAEKIAPTDPIILGNIADCYFNKHDKTNSILYYEGLKKFGDAEQKQLADEKIKVINHW